MTTTEFPAIDLVPGNDWDRKIAIYQADGSIQPLTGWTVSLAEVRWRGGSVTLATDLTEAASGIVRVTADKADTTGLPFAAPAGEIELTMVETGDKTVTQYWARVNGVHVASSGDIAVLHPGTQGDVGVNPPQAWALATDFVARDVATHDGSAWYCKAAHTASAATEPGVGASWATYWTLLAAGLDAAPADISTVAGIAADVATVAGVSAEVATVAGIGASVVAVAADEADIGVVASGMADVNAVADGIADVSVAASNIAAIQAAPAAASAAAASASDAASSAAVAETARDEAVGVTGGIYANVTAGLAAVAEGEYFCIPNADYSQRYWYRKIASKAVYQFARPYADALTNTTILGLLTAPHIVGSLPIAPLVDFDSARTLRDVTKFRNLARDADPDNNMVGYGAANAKTRSVTYGQYGAVVTDGAADADGGTSGFNVQAAAAATGSSPRCIPYYGITVPPGQWTIAFDVQAVGAAQAFAWHPDIIGGLGASWQTDAALGTGSTTKSYTFETTTEKRIYPVWAASKSVTPTDALNVNISGLRIVPGAAAGDPSTSNRDVVTRTLIGPLRSGLFLSNAGAQSQNRMVVQLDGRETHDALSFLACIKWDGDTARVPVLFTGSSDDPVPTESGMYFAPSSIHTMTLQTPGGVAKRPMASPYNAGWCVVGFTMSATGRKVYMNGRLASADTNSAGSITVSYFGLLGQSASHWFTGETSGLLLYDQELTEAQMAAASNVLINRLLVKGQSFSERQSFLFCEGDSLSTSGGVTGGGTGYNFQIGSAFNPHLQGCNLAVSGSTLAGMIARQATATAAVEAMAAEGKTVVFSVFIGANDLVGITTSGAADDYYADLAAYWSGLRAAGAKVIACTLIPRSGLASETYLNQINDAIRGDASKYDGLADFQANPAFATYIAANFYDGVHPNNASHDVLATVLLPIVQGLVV